MEQIAGISRFIRSVPAEKATEAPKNEQASSDFDTLLRGLLVPDAQDQVSEEALFASLLVERIRNLKGEEASKQFRELLTQNESAMMKPNGYVPHEDAARAALQTFRDQGGLTAEEADTVHSEAFGAAQLDSNLDALYDHLGGADDPTKAVKSVSESITSAAAVIAKYTAGTEKPIARPIDAGLQRSSQGALNPYDNGLGISPEIGAEAGTEILPGVVNEPTGTTMDGQDGFLFKPISENQQKLAILLPSSLSAMAMSVLLKDGNGDVIEEGTILGDGFNNEGSTRKKFNFTKKGEEYPPNLTVEARMADGSVVSWKIPDPAQRYD